MGSPWAPWGLLTSIHQLQAVMKVHRFKGPKPCLGDGQSFPEKVPSMF